VSATNIVESSIDINSLTYIFDFGDGNQTSSNSSWLWHKWTNAGDYKVAITCIDDQAALLQKNDDITISNVLPSGNFDYDIEIPSSYSFTYDFAGSTPIDWTLSGASTKNYIKVSDGVEKLHKTLKIDTEGEYIDQDYYTEINVGNQYFGTVEYYFYTSNSSSSVGYISFLSGGSEVFTIYPKTSGLRYRCDNINQSIQGLDTIENDTLNHVRIDFVLDITKISTYDYFGVLDDQFQIYIDGVPSYCSYSIADANANKITSIRFGAMDKSIGTVHIDAVGFSWDEDYTIGSSFNILQDSYYGTYDFRSDIIGTNPDQWNITEEEDPTVSGVYFATYSFENGKGFDIPYGWMDDSVGSSTIENITSEDGHSGVLKFTDNAGANDFTRLDHLIDSSEITSGGTIEFWYYRESGTGTFDFFVFDNPGTVVFNLRIEGNTIKYERFNDPSKEWVTIGTIGEDTWHHFRIDMAGDSDGYLGMEAETVSIWIDNILKVSEFLFWRSMGCI
jgi:hypothetical protein